MVSRIRLCLVGDVLVAHKKDDLLDSRLHSGCRVRIRNSDASVRRNPGNSSRFSYFLVGHTICRRAYRADLHLEEEKESNQVPERTGCRRPLRTDVHPSHPRPASRFHRRRCFSQSGSAAMGDVALPKVP